MRINMVIVDEDPDRALRAGRLMANAMRQDMRDWTMHVHVRKPENLVGREDAYAKHTG